MRSRGPYSCIFSLALLASVLLFGGCGSIFCYPSRDEFTQPKALGLSYQDIWFKNSEGNQLHGWLLSPSGEKKGTLIFLHGNAENITSHVLSVHWLPQYGYEVFLFDYRGYGKSEGKASIEGLVDDSESALRYLNSRQDVGDIVLMGQSLGGTIALKVAAKAENQSRLKALVLESAFSDFRGIVREKLDSLWLTWPLQYPLSWLVSSHYSPIEEAKSISDLPMLFIHGEEDPIVPVHHGDALYAAAGSSKKSFWRVPGAGHIGVLRNEEYRRKFLSFLRVVFAPKETDLE